MLMHTGAHWLKGTLGMLPRGLTLRRAGESRGTLETIDKAHERRPLPHITTLNILQLHHPTPTADHHTSPYPSAAEVLVAERNVGVRLVANANDQEGQNIRARWD